jgi:hypothetical protein
MKNHLEIKQLARANSREVCARSAGFRNLEFAEQKAMFEGVYRDEYTRLMKEHGLQPQGQTTRLSAQQSLSPQRRDLAQGMVASDLIDDDRHLNRRIDQAGELMGGFVEDVNFPKFVADLLKAVFDANLDVTLSQMEAYTELLKEATKSVSSYVKDVSDDEAFAHLIEHRGDEFGMIFEDAKPTLIDASGDPVDLDDSEIKAKIVDAKLALAKERRTLLREMILMGISRLVVEKGTVKADVSFSIKATEKIKKRDNANENLLEVKQKWRSRGFFASLFGGGGRRQETKQTSQITVSSTKSDSSTDLSAKMSGHVEIQFKSDYFKLDNFADSFGNVGNEDQQADAKPNPTKALPSE